MLQASSPGLRGGQGSSAGGRAGEGSCIGKDNFTAILNFSTEKSHPAIFKALGRVERGVILFPKSRLPGDSMCSVTVHLILYL